MKKFYIILAFLLVSTSIFAQLNEGFEGTTFPPTGWTVINGGDAGTWIRYTTTPHTGVACAAISFGTTAHADYLITPKLAIAAGSNTLTAWFKSQDATLPEPYDVMISTTGTATTDFTLLLAEPDPGTTWVQKTYDLSAYNGQNIYVAFRSTTTDQWRLYMDDVAGPNIWVPANDVGVTAVIAPIGAMLPGSVAPQVTVKNFGSATQTNIPVSYKIGATGTVVSTTIASLASGATTNVSFPSWTATNGNYNFIFYTGLTGDMVNTNDTMVKNVTVAPVLTPAYCFKGGQPSKFYLEAPQGGFFDIGTAKPWLSRGGAYVATATSKKWFVLGHNYNLYSMDTLTGDTTLVGPTGGSGYFLGLTYDRSTSTLYASGITTAAPYVFSLYTINQTTGAATLVAASPTNGLFFEIACNAAGQMYVIETSTTAGVNAKLYSVNKTTAALTLIGTDMGAPMSLSFQDIDFAPNGNLYFSATKGTTVGALDGLYTLNTTTGVATLVGAFPVAATQVTGLAIPYTLSAGATITFNVSNGTTPISGANVKINGVNFITNASGIASTYLAAGSYPDTISAFGYITKTKNVTVVAGVNQTILDTLIAATTYAATFTVQNSTSTPLAGAAIVVTQGTNIFNGTTNASGVYAFNLPAGIYNYTVSLAGYIPQTSTFTLTTANLPIAITLSSCTVSTFPWTESFEDTTSFGCFTKANPDGGTGWAHIVSGKTPLPGWNIGTMTIPTGGGNAAAYCTWNTGGATSNDQWLITPQIAVQNNQELNFSLFWFGHYQDNLDIKVSTTTNATSSFTTTLLATDTNQYIYGGWKQFTIPLTAYAGQSIYIAFNEHIANNQADGAFIGIDLVKIDVSTGINETNESGLVSVYPNPVKNELNITSVASLKNVKIINAIGQEIMNENVRGNLYKINTSSYKKGIYFVQIESEKGKTTKKFIVSE